MRSLAPLLLLSLVTSSSFAETVEKRITYKHNGVNLVGFEYFDSENTEKSPGILIFSDWMGIGEFVKERGREFADLGYRAFVADIYGDGRSAKDAKEAETLAAKFKADRLLFRDRAKAALDTFLKDPLVDSTEIGAIGFCFGGTAALELARQGAPIKGVVSFHGSLETPDKTLAKNIKARLLILHGADDPLVPPTEVQAFEDEMKKGNVTWELVKYSNAVHAYTNPDAGNDNSKGAAYNKLASDRSFAAMDGFFDEVFFKEEEDLKE